jgi:hypothetical protein
LHKETVTGISLSLEQLSAAIFFFSSPSLAASPKLLLVTTMQPWHQIASPMLLTT